MDCNCININANGEGQLPEIRHVYGNVLRLGIPLTLRTIEMVNGKPKATDSDFIPSSNYPVNVIFSKAAVQITQISIEATMRDDNVACIEDRGTIPVGTYDITVACNDDSGNPYRFKQLASLKVVDTTAEAGIEKGIEYEVETWYLRAAIFLVLKGDAGETVQVQSDWEETDIGNPAFIKNKPTIPDVSNFATKSEVQGKADASDVYTKAEVDSALDLKEDAIDDLSAIRSGAAAGATAYQKPASGIPASDLADGVIPDVSGFVTASDVADAVADLVDSAPETLDTLNELAEALGDDPNFATTMTTALAGKVDKVTGKGLSTEDYTTAEKTKLANLATVATTGSYNDLTDKPVIPEDADLSGYYDKTEVDGMLDDKVDKVTGKGLSTNDYTTAEKTKLAGLSNYDDTALQAAVAGKVDKENGKSLMTDAEKTKLAGIEAGAKNSTMIVKVTSINQGLEADHTFTEIAAAIEDGKNVVVINTGDEKVYQLSYYAPSEAYFTSCQGDEGTFSCLFFDELGVEFAGEASIPSIDNTLSNSSTSPVENRVITAALAGKANSADLAEKANSADLASVATSGSYNDLDNKPTIPDELADLASDSSHRTVTDTEKSSWNGKADAISVVNVSTTGSVSQTIDPNKFYKFGSIDSLALSLTAGTGFIVYAGKFTASANWGGTKLSVPANVTEASGNDTVEAGKMYEFSIMDDIIIVKEVG